MIRSSIKRGLRKVLGVDTSTPAPEPVEVRPTPPASQPPDTPAPVAEAPAEANASVEPLDLAKVQDVLDEMVRPGVQADGGDIELVRIDENDVYVRLVGACSSCPSSTMTLRLGVEALLREEFPGMRELIQVA